MSVLQMYSVSMKAFKILTDVLLFDQPAICHRHQLSDAELLSGSYPGSSW